MRNDLEQSLALIVGMSQNCDLYQIDGCIVVRPLLK